MLDEFEVVSVPLEKNAQGIIRVAGTRVSLDSIMNAYYEGATADEIVLRFPSCTIENIYTILSWALNHSQAVQAYLQQQAAVQNRLQQEIKREFSSTGIRNRLLIRSQKSQP